MSLNHVTLDDKYDLAKSRIFVTGYQALVRLTMMQHERDKRAGLNTAGYVTGYRGSPLGGLDYQFQRAAQHLAPRNVLFQSAINEDLAATALWGSQQAELRGEGKYDGVFGIWYGKGPGVDRSGDAFRHANFAGTSKHGGVLALMGDDHTAESSTTAHQSEFNFVDVMIPILNPAGVQEIIDYGLYGFAMSRFTGAWVGLKCMHETVESTAVVDGSLDRLGILLPDPDEYTMPAGGLNIRLVDTVLGMEARLHDHKRDAMLAFVRVNKLNKVITSGGRNPKIGVITTGKSYLDVRQALDELGIDEVKANDWGMRIHKIACPWPIGRQELQDFARGLELIIVVEEKRSLIEVQVREELYGTANQPICIGKKDEQGNWLFPVKGALDPNDVAICIGERLLKYVGDENLKGRVARLKEAQERLAVTQDVAVRIPYFCSGCPHNSSTVVPEGSRAYAGIGCHYMAQWMDRSTLGFTQMGGEGANWIGEAPFSMRPHVFQNIGDGTYNHSGYMAIRASIAAGVNVTYKILFNDAVAMTGGQMHDGTLTVPKIAAQVAAEGASRIVVVSDEPKKYPPGTQWPEGITFHHRDDLQQVQTDLAHVPGCTILIYDQTCAAEKRRRRKRGTFPDPEKRVIVNELVCEGCGDCGVKSNCVSVQPLETEWGRKRTIDQSSCNKDFSCVKGFCPSFVTVHGATLKKGKGVAQDHEVKPLPEPELPRIDHTYNIIVTGVGGTGIVTIGGILGMAAHLEGKATGVIDMAGLAQKGGAVYSHMRIAERPEDIHAIRVAAGGADLVLGGDIVVAGNKKVLAAVKAGRTAMIINTSEFMPGDFTRNADFSLPTERLRRAISQRGRPRPHAFRRCQPARHRAVRLLARRQHLHGRLRLSARRAAAVGLGDRAGDRAERRGGADESRRVPLGPESRPRSSRGGRPRAACARDARREPAALAVVRGDGVAAGQVPHRVSEQALCGALPQMGGKGEGGRAAARAGEMRSRRRRRPLSVQADGLQGRVRGGAALHRRHVPQAGRERSRRRQAPLRIPHGAALARQDRSGDRRASQDELRPLDDERVQGAGEAEIPARHAARRVRPHRGAPHRAQADHGLRGDARRGAARLNAGNHALAVGLAAIPEKIRGFGHVKARHLAAAKADEAALLEQFRSGKPPLLKAAE